MINLLTFYFLRVASAAAAAAITNGNNATDEGEDSQNATNPNSFDDPFHDIIPEPPSHTRPIAPLKHSQNIHHHHHVLYNACSNGYVKIFVNRNIP